MVCEAVQPSFDKGGGSPKSCGAPGMPGEGVGHVDHRSSRKHFCGHASDRAGNGGVRLNEIELLGSQNTGQLTEGRNILLKTSMVIQCQRMHADTVALELRPQ